MPEADGHTDGIENGALAMPVGLRFVRQISGKACLLASLIALVTALSAPHLLGRFVDFRAFYCAGQAQLAGADPYREHPLRECERSVSAPGLPPVNVGTTVPAPFPGFALALFAVLAFLPFAWALLIWEGAACVAVGIAIALVARTTRTSLTANAIVMGFPAVVVALQLGQVTPFVLLGVAASAALLQSGRPQLAALASLGALLDPHVGLALCIGIFVGVPRSRDVLITGALALTALGLLVSGPQQEWEYVRSVLPAHALANLTDAQQFSATNVAFEAGLPSRAALNLGGLWYVVSSTAGILVALRLRRRFGCAAVAYIPVAFAVFGGLHTHIQQLAVAIPAFMLLSAAAPAGLRRDGWTGVTFVAAMPWITIAPVPWLFVVPTALAVLFARQMGSARQGLRLAAGSFVALCVISISIVRSYTVHKVVDLNLPGNPLAEVPWRMYTLARNTPAEPWYVFARAPTAIAFILLLIACVQIARGKSGILTVTSPAELIA